MRFAGPVEVTMTVNRSTRDWKHRSKKSMIMVSGPSPTELTGLPQPKYTIKGQDPAVDKLWRKYNRIELSVQRAFLDLKHRELLSAFGFAVGDGRLQFKWSRTAGCSCGCSPGWLPYRDGRRIHSAVDGKRVVVSIAAVTPAMKTAMQEQKATTASKSAELMLAGGI